MSFIGCDECGDLIDSDDDPACFIDPPDYTPVHLRVTIGTTVLCENCRERAWDRQQERLMEDGGGPSLLEQQRAALKFK